MGVDASITFHGDVMTVRTGGWVKTKAHELPVKRVESVLIQRKGVVPFAALTLMAAIAAVVAGFNALWFLIPLDPPRNLQVATVAMIAGVLFAIPTLSRVLFVNVVINWDGRPKSFLVHFVRAGSGRRLARRFHRISAGT